MLFSSPSSGQLWPGSPGDAAVAGPWQPPPLFSPGSLTGEACVAPQRLIPWVLPVTEDVDHHPEELVLHLSPSPSFLLCLQPRVFWGAPSQTESELLQSQISAFRAEGSRNSGGVG